MDLSEYLLMLVKAYNPNQYEKLLEKKGREFVTFFLVTLVFCMVLFTALLVPATYHYIGTIPDTTAQVDKLQLSAEVSAPHPVTLLGRPSIVLDLEANETAKGEFTLSEEGLIYPKYLFFGTGIIHWSEIRDLKTQTPTRDNILSGMIMFLLPSIIFWFFLYSLIKLSLVFLILIIIGYLVPKAFKHHISFKHAAKLGILALPSMLVMDLGLYPLAPLFWWGLMLTTVFFFVGVAVTCELPDDDEPRRDHHEHTHRRHD